MLTVFPYISKSGVVDMLGLYINSKFLGKVDVRIMIQENTSLPRHAPPARHALANIVKAVKEMVWSPGLQCPYIFALFLPPVCVQSIGGKQATRQQL
jgi:hypothetical protein